MKCLKAMIGKAAVLFLLLCPMTAWGQSDVDKQDPRGVYKLMTITSYGEERPSPFDQYKICTDSISLTVVVEGDGAFMIVRNDRDILNYTGDVTEGDTDTRVRVYDSNEQEFMLKWWSTYENHSLFPNNAWVVERYRAGEYSHHGSKIFPVITKQQARDRKNDLLGEWRIIGITHDMKDMKKQVERMKDENQVMTATTPMVVFTPEKFFMVLTGRGVGMMVDVKYDNKNSVTYGGKAYPIRLMGSDVMIMEAMRDTGTSYEVYERLTDGRSIVSRVAERLVE